MNQCKTVYIAGRITGDPDYKAKFADAAARLEGLGFVALSPAILPGGLSLADYMKIDMSMIDVADLVVFLPDWNQSGGAQLEKHYCDYTQKPHCFLSDLCDIPTAGRLDEMMNDIDRLILCSDSDAQEPLGITIDYGSGDSKSGAIMPEIEAIGKAFDSFDASAAVLTSKLAKMMIRRNDAPGKVIDGDFSKRK